LILTIVFYSAAGIALLISLIKSREKTGKVVKTAGKNLLFLLPELLGLILILSLILTLVPGEKIARWLGHPVKILSTLFGAAVGTLVIMPGFVAFPLARELVSRGAHLSAIAAFVTTLMMVGFATLPLETKMFGRKFALWRLVLSFVTALITALIMGVLL
jgi:uncharacterized membrane protein YraQ (UPF0718 family)